MPATFEKVEQDVLDLVKQAIDQWHPGLKPARIGVAFRSEAQKKGDKEIWATISKVSPHVAVLARLDYVLWLAKPIWEKLPLAARLALLDHELCHAYQNDNYDWAIREHDVEEFYEIIVRHGLWRRDLVQLGRVIQEAQARFPGFEDDLTITLAAEGRVVTLDSAMATAIGAS